MTHPNFADMMITRDGFADSEALGSVLASASFTLADIATGQAATIPAAVQVCRTQSYANARYGVGGARYKRVSAQPSHALCFRSLDRYLANGTVSSGNGGWWEICEESITVEMAGAVGNGTTADHSAISAALTAASVLGRKEVFASAKTYAFGARAPWVNGVAFIGRKNITKFVVLNSNTDVTGKFLASNGQSDIYIYGVIFDGSGSPDANQFMQFFGTTDVDIEHCRFINSKGLAIAASTNVKNLRIRKCRFKDIAFSTGIGGTAGTQAVSLAGTGNENFVVDDCDFENVAWGSVIFAGCDGVQVTNCRLKNSYTLVYSLNSNLSKNVLISGNRAIGGVNAAGSEIVQPQCIDINNVDGLVITNNQISDYGGAGIGLFAAVKNAYIGGNIIARCARGWFGDVEGVGAYKCGIAVSANAGTEPANILVDDNTIYDDAVSPTMIYGIVVTPAADVMIGERNRIRNAITADIAVIDYTVENTNGTVIRTYSHDEGLISLHPGYVASKWFEPMGTSWAGTPAAQVADTIYFAPLVLPRRAKISNVGVRVHTGVAAATALVGIYATNKDGYPGVRLAAGAASLDCSTSSSSPTVSLDATVTLEAGVYWIATLCSAAFTLKTLSPTSHSLAPIGSATFNSVANAASPTGYSASRTYASGLPTDASGLTLAEVTSTATTPGVCFKTAA